MVYFVYHFKQQMPLPTKKVDKQPWIKQSPQTQAKPPHPRQKLPSNAPPRHMMNDSLCDQGKS